MSDIEAAARKEVQEFVQKMSDGLVLEPRDEAIAGLSAGLLSEILIEMRIIRIMMESDKEGALETAKQIAEHLWDEPLPPYPPRPDTE